MSLIDGLALGQYVPADTPLHRLYPGVKLLGLPACVIAAFACNSPLQLVGLTVWALILSITSGQLRRIWGRGVWQLRYLFLVTIVLHTVLSPGRTLLGMSWLSQDGLLFGVQVAGKLAVAVVFSSLMTLTTSPNELVDSLHRFISPLSKVTKWFEEMLLFLSLVLYFIPVLRQEVQRVWSPASGKEELREKGFLMRVERTAHLSESLIHGLLDRTDELAARLVGGEDLFGTTVDKVPVCDPFVKQLPWVVAGAVWLLLVLVGLD